MSSEDNLKKRMLSNKDPPKHIEDWERQITMRQCLGFPDAVCTWCTNPWLFYKKKQRTGNGCYLFR